MDLLYPHLSVNRAGRLTVGGLDAVELARAYGTPVYLIDEDAVRARMRLYREAARRCFGPDATLLYASKALCFTGMYRIAAEEGFGADCVSAGELYTARAARFPAERVCLHGSNKTERDIRDAMDMGVGVIAADGTDDLLALEACAAERGATQRVLLRVTPGVSPRTHRAVSTGPTDSKFGFPIETGQAMEAVRLAVRLPHLHTAGFHCHIGSQIFDAAPFVEAARVVLRFARDVRDEVGFEAEELNLGGGFGVPYVEEDPRPDYGALIGALADAVRADCRAYGLAAPRVTLEPGRSIVAHAGVTLYTVGSVREIPGRRTYVSVDGGMSDNPRYALYGSRYTALIADRADAPRTARVTVAGRLCESGDLIGEGMPLQEARRGDTLAVLTTGAYNYSMASNYNRLPRPPIVLIRNGRARVAVRRESPEDLIRNDLP